MLAIVFLERVDNGIKPAIYEEKATERLHRFSLDPRIVMRSTERVGSLT